MAATPLTITPGLPTLRLKDPRPLPKNRNRKFLGNSHSVFSHIAKLERLHHSPSKPQE